MIISPWRASLRKTLFWSFFLQIFHWFRKYSYKNNFFSASLTWNMETDSPLIMMLAMVDANKVFRMLRKGQNNQTILQITCWEGRKAITKAVTKTTRALTTRREQNRNSCNSHERKTSSNNTNNNKSTTSTNKNNNNKKTSHLRR